MSKLRTDFLTENNFHLWDEFIDSSAQGSIYSKSFWVESISKLTNTQFKILAVLSGQDILGGIVIYIKKNPLGKMVKCPPLTPYNSIILKDPVTKYPSKITSKNLEITKTIINTLENSNYASIEIKNSPSLTDNRAFIWKNWDLNVSYTYKVPLFDIDNLKEIIGSNVRKQIKKCEKTGIHVITDFKNNDFQSMYGVLTSKEKNFPRSIEEDKFKNFLEGLKNKNCYRIYTANLKNGEIISVRIALFTKHCVAHDWVAGTNPEYLQSGVTPFLLWKIIEDLSQKKYKYFDLNGANSETVAKFKSEFGGKLIPYYTARRVKPYLKIPLFLARKLTN